MPAAEKCCKVIMAMAAKVSLLSRNDFDSLPSGLLKKLVTS